MTGDRATYSHSGFNARFGFAGAGVKNLLEKASMLDLMDPIRRYYGGDDFDEAAEA